MIDLAVFIIARFLFLVPVAFSKTLSSVTVISTGIFLKDLCVFPSGPVTCNILDLYVTLTFSGISTSVANFSICLVDISYQKPP